MKQYELVIFDFDGTLVDTAPDIATHVNRTLSEMGMQECSLIQVKQAIGRGVHELFKDLDRRFIEDPALLEKTVQTFKKRYTEEPVIETALYPQAEQMLQNLFRQHKKAIVTNKPFLLTQKILLELKLEMYFSKVVGGENGYPYKPDPKGVLDVIRMLNTVPKKTLFIGDSRIDAETATNAKTHFLWVDYGYDLSLAQDPTIRRLDIS